MKKQCAQPPATVPPCAWRPKLPVTEPAKAKPRYVAPLSRTTKIGNSTVHATTGKLADATGAVSPADRRHGGGSLPPMHHRRPRLTTHALPASAQRSLMTHFSACAADELKAQ